MAIGSSSPFERLRERYEDTDARCDECGYVDDERGWQVTTTGDRVRYERVCRVCGAAAVRELRL